jgi:hypothetical protein
VLCTFFSRDWGKDSGVNAWYFENGIERSHMICWRLVRKWLGMFLFLKFMDNDVTTVSTFCPMSQNKNSSVSTGGNFGKSR